MSQEDKKEEKPKKTERPVNPFLAKQNARHSLLAGLAPAADENTEVPTPTVLTQPKISLQTSIIDLMTEKKKKRNRDWDNLPEHQATHFRGVSTTLRDAITEIARELSVTASDVARAFLEYALQTYREGHLNIEPILSAGKMTLFPKDGWSIRGWQKTLSAAPPAARGAAKNKPRPKSWQAEVSYRGIPADLHEAIRNISKHNRVPIGEVVSLFFSHSLKAYQNGQLTLTPSQDKTLNTYNPS